MSDLEFIITSAADILGGLLHLVERLMVYGVGSIALGYMVWSLWRLVYCAWRGEPEWKGHADNIMASSPLYAVAVLAAREADIQADKADMRADVIDRAIAEGRDPYDAVREAGLD